MLIILHMLNGRSIMPFSCLKVWLYQNFFDKKDFDYSYLDSHLSNIVLIITSDLLLGTINI